MKKLFTDVNWKVLGSLFLLMIPVIVFWSTVFVFPLKILVVFFHELSHGLMAVITGGSIDHIEVNSMQGGLCVTMGGSRFLTLTAGYLGSLVWGGLILVLAARTRYDKQIAGVLGGLVLLVTILFMRPFISFGFLFGILTGGALVASGYFAPEKVNDYILKVVGLTSVLYAVLDIKSDILDRPELQSDAAMLGELTGIPTMVWGVIWILVALAAGFFFLLVASKHDATAAASSETPQTT